MKPVPRAYHEWVIRRKLVRWYVLDAPEIRTGLSVSPRFEVSVYWGLNMRPAHLGLRVYWGVKSGSPRLRDLVVSAHFGGRIYWVTYCTS